MTSQTHFLRRSELLIFLSQTFFVTHKFIHVLGKRIPTTFLGHHLIGTYDLLIEAGCDIDVATAGALHSLYGTDAFTRTTIPPNLMERKKIRQRFGERAEKLAFLFHACNRNDHPKNIEMGRLFDRRCGVPLPGVTVEDIQALRLIEAANMIEQGSAERMVHNLPTVHETWLHQLLLKSHQCALGELPLNHTQQPSDVRGALIFGQRFPSFLLPPSPTHVATAPVALSLMIFAEGADYGHEHWMSIKTEEDFQNMYATFLDILQRDHFYRRGGSNHLVTGSPDGTRRVMEGSAPLLVINKQTDGTNGATTSSANRNNNGIHAKIGVVDGVSIGMTPDNHSDNHNGHFNTRQESMRDNVSPQIVFCLRGEASFGMPWTPLWMLLRFASRRCGKKPSVWKNLCGRRSLTSSYEGTLEIEIRYLQEHDFSDMSHLPPCLIAQEQLNRALFARGGLGITPPAITYQSLCSSGRLSSMAAGHVIDSLRSFGYAIISMDDAATSAIARSYDAVLRFQANVPVEEKRKFVRFFDNSRYVGWARDPAREWLQLRARDGGNDLDDGDGLPMPWPPSADRDDSRDMMNAVNLLTRSAERIFEEMGIRLNLGTRQYLRRLCRNHPTTVDDVNLPSPVSSVCRLFVYLDKVNNNNNNNEPGNGVATATAPGKMPSTVQTTLPPPPLPLTFPPGHPNNMRMISASGAHADMGLLTLSPSSTIPALNLLHPQTQITLQPEIGLAPNEWVLFAGETLSFLTSGALQAPIHSVPFIDRHEVARAQARQTGSIPVVPPLRRSMPLFLRAVPEAHLFPLSKGTADMTMVQTCNEVRSYVPPPPPIPTPPSLDHDHSTESLAMPLASEPFDATTTMLPGNYISDGNHNNNQNSSVGNGGQLLTPSNTLPMSSRAMTCRDFTVNHALGMRPWRLGSGTDF